ncbi:MAG TPA: HEAT repeat domain-containing protein, partial [Pyrinomonadaceae bacterium]|nr:HEAT repeat domain-containing protein [Pyrinomonadaceae bacterium]
MKKFTIAFFLTLICFSLTVSAQIQTNILVQIVKAEDERRFDKTLEDLMKNPSPKIRVRATLAAGRIGNESAIPALINLLENDKDTEVRTMAAFALGEIESTKAADAILKVLRDTKNADAVRARATEAAGKIAAANAKDEKSKDLGKAILETLEFEDARRSISSRDVILLGLTAVLRARPEQGDAATAKFLTYPDERIRIDAGNTLTRLRAKNANEALRKMLANDSNAAARANAARALGAAEDKDSLDLLMKAALSDEDSRVRVSAIRAVGSLKDKKSAEKLIQRGEILLAQSKRSKFKNPSEKSELLEIATVLGRLLPNSDDKKAVAFLDNLRQADKFSSPETEIALARIAPKIYVDSVVAEAQSLFTEDWRTSSAAFQGLGEIANLEANKETDAVKSRTRVLLVQFISLWLTSNPKSNATDNARFAIPDLIRAFAAFKSENTSGILRPMLEIEPDIFIRAAIAEILGDQPSSKENVEALNKAFTYSLLRDKTYNDATLAIMDALFKLDKKEASGFAIIALSSSDYLVRKKALEWLRDEDLQKDLPGLPTILENALAKKKDQLSTFSISSKLGVILNTNADYTRAVSRKNGSVKAVLTTEKGTFTIELMPEDAPLTVDNFVKLARANYFNGLAVHRVVPNFVMQDGDPRGDGNGGPGWEIRCELNMLPYERGAVGMALSGKDTGGSQWFVTHSPQPHLDGGYTVFGRVNE